MTTIAWDTKYLAADSMVTEGGVICGYEDKIIKLTAGWLASTGHMTDRYKFIAWIEKGMPDEKPTLHDDFEAVLLRPDGLLEFDVDLVGTRVEYSAAWGSGKGWAMSAMDFGKSAKGAVKYAQTRDVYTGGKIQVVKF